jgi:hypothetical protein
MNKKPSRREFLKLAGMTSAGLALRPSEYEPFVI